MNTKMLNVPPDVVTTAYNKPNMIHDPKSINRIILANLVKTAAKIALV